MAKQTQAREGIYVAKPRADAFLAIVILTSVALLAAVAILWLEWSSLK
jgi:hypothetical protein